MKFYTVKDVPVTRNDRVFRAPPVTAFITSLVFLALAISLFALGRSGGYFLHGWSVPPFIAYIGAVVFGVATLFGLGSFRARLKPSNWLLRCNPSGIVVKYRAYQNWRMPADDVQAVGFDYSEIAWARKARERRTAPGMDNSTQVQSLSYLEFGLINPDTGPLESKLDEERRRPSSVRSLRYPVEVAPGGIVRLHWRDAGGGTFSHPDNALRYLRSFVKIAEEVFTKTNVVQPDPDSLQQEGKILLLARRGDKLGAIKLTRKIRGCSLEEATKHVETL